MDYQLQVTKKHIPAASVLGETPRLPHLKAEKLVWLEVTAGADCCPWTTERALTAGLDFWLKQMNTMLSDMPKVIQEVCGRVRNRHAAFVFLKTLDCYS